MQQSVALTKLISKFVKMIVKTSQCFFLRCKKSILFNYSHYRAIEGPLSVDDIKKNNNFQSLEFQTIKNKFLSSSTIEDFFGHFKSNICNEWILIKFTG